MSTDKLLFTSIPPSLSRMQDGVQIGPKYQRLCIDSWVKAGFHVISINPPCEVNELVKLNYPVEVCATKGDVRPRVSNVLELAAKAKADLCSIINADCMLISTDQSMKNLSYVTGNTLRFIERIDVDRDSGAAVPGNCAGFDAFFFSPEVADKCVKDLYFRLGDPWWDYWFPCECASLGVKLERLSNPTVLHLNHPTAWRHDDWLSNGTYFRGRLARMKSIRPDGQFPPSTDDLPLSQLSRTVHDWLRHAGGRAGVRLFAAQNDTLMDLTASLREFHSHHGPAKIKQLEKEKREQEQVLKRVSEGNTSRQRASGSIFPDLRNSRLGKKLLHMGLIEGGGTKRRIYRIIYFLDKLLASFPFASAAFVFVVFCLAVLPFLVESAFAIREELWGAAVLLIVTAAAVLLALLLKRALGRLRELQRQLGGRQSKTIRRSNYDTK